MTHAEDTAQIEEVMTVQNSLGRLIEALRYHAELMSTPDVAGNAGVEAFYALRRAAIAYGRSVREGTQWDSPFAELEEDEEFAPDDEEATAAFDGEPGGDRLVVSGAWTFDVIDRNAWCTYVSQQLATVAGAPQRLSGDPAEAAATLLTYADLFAPLVGSGLVNVDQEWTVQDAHDPGDFPEDMDG